MSKGKIVIGLVAAVIVVAAVAASGGTKGNTLANPTPSAASPAQASQPAAAASPAQASQPAAKAYTTGDRVKLGDEEHFTLVKVEKNWKSTNQFIKPEAGKMFVTFLVQIEGINANGATYNPLFFKVRDEQGFEYNVSLIGRDPALQSSNDLKPGAKVQGWVTFETPTAVKTLTLIYAPGFLGEPVEFTVKI